MNRQSEIELDYIKRNMSRWNEEERLAALFKSKEKGMGTYERQNEVIERIKGTSCGSYETEDKEYDSGL